MERLTRRYIVNSLNNLNLSNPIRYERFYINDNLRIQNRDNKLEKEVLDDNNKVIEKLEIEEELFIKLKQEAYSEIIRDSYLYLDDDRISIKKYYGKYEGLNRVEVEFSSVEEMKCYEKEEWMGKEITNSPLAFDKYLSKLSNEEFKSELNIFIKEDL